jgi:hypothetical protein
MRDFVNVVKRPRPQYMDLNYFPWNIRFRKEAIFLIGILDLALADILTDR